MRRDNAARRRRVWVRYADDVDDTAMALIKKPVAVYIEKVYDDAAFSGLGI